MIKNMLKKIKPYLPLKISEVIWNEAEFQIHGDEWHFITLSAWRICKDDKVIFGCHDQNSADLLNQIQNLYIVEVLAQSGPLAIDPVFQLSNGYKIEIFSTDTYEPWTFRIDPLPMYIATPGEPSVFDGALKDE